MYSSKVLEEKYQNRELTVSVQKIIDKAEKRYCTCIKPSKNKAFGNLGAFCNTCGRFIKE